MEEAATTGSDKEFGTLHINGALQSEGNFIGNGTVGIGGMSTSLWNG